MDKDIKQRWVDALRSGEYRQVRGTLKQPEADGGVGYCCLGVLCDLHAIETGGEWEVFDVMYRYLGSGALLDDRVQAWAGLDSENPAVYKDGDYLTTLAELNDGDNLREARTFRQIADMIERDL